VDDGFYYDVDSSHRFSEDDFQAIEAEIAKIIAEDLPIHRKVLTKSDARDFYRANPFKTEIIEEIGDDEISFYCQGDFSDLCRGPHLPSTGRVKLVKILKVAGAYWRGSEKNRMLQRIYAEAFSSDKELAEYLKKMEEAEKRDHRRLGKDLDLFSIHEEAGPGLVFWHPNGAALRSVVETFWKEEHQKRGYRFMNTPHIADSRLWTISGHLSNYSENMYSAIDIDEKDYILKPMNCPFHILVYKNALRSYRDLPLRWAELGTVYRYEKSGVLHGMLRVRGFTQDDAHIFCRPDQLETELRDTLNLAFFMLRTFGFSEYKVMLATKPENSVGEPEIWEKATEALKSALASEKVSYVVDEGGGAFYGPKIDIKLVDAIGREWQGPTIQVDFNLPERFDMTFIGQDGAKHRPVMVHRAVLGSMERFVGTLIEHYSGRFPLWLAPVQAIVLPVSDGQVEYARKVEESLRQALVRVETDLTDNKLSYKIREAQVRQIPYMLVVGEREAAAGSVNIRSRDGREVGVRTVDEALAMFLEEIRSKKGNKSEEDTH
jgi:threonyl-tRNA synthetase